MKKAKAAATKADLDELKKRGSLLEKEREGVKEYKWSAALVDFYRSRFTYDTHLFPSASFSVSHDLMESFSLF